MRYDIEADWYLLYTCNFRCSYCFFSSDLLGARIKTYGTPIQWKEAFDATQKTWLLHLTGGEPGIYPGFVDLCEQLTQSHYLSINSNVSHPSINEFARRIDPKRVHFFNAAIHYEIRQRRNILGAFVEGVHALQDAKFSVLSSLVMTPQVLENYPEISRRLESDGLFPIPKIIRGIYEGKRYPESYTNEQKRLIVEYIAQAEKNYKRLQSVMDEPPSINMFSDHLFLNGIEDCRGRLCSAGSLFVAIAPNGTVTRCGPPEVLGNILMRDLHLMNSPKECNTGYCPYFCIKYSLKENTGDGRKLKPIPSMYSRLKGILRTTYYVARTDGIHELLQKLSSKSTHASS